MSKKTIALLVITCFITCVISVSLFWIIASVKGYPNLDFLTFIVGLNTIMTTIAIALAAYKVISAREVRDVVEEHIQIINNKVENDLNTMRNDLQNYTDNSINSLAFNVDTLIMAAQERAIIIMKERNIRHKPPHYRELVDYINEMDKEIISMLHMLLLTSSANPNERLKGYGLLATIEVNEIRKYFSQKIEEEENETNRKFLSNFLYRESIEG